ncbi:hypothetical protein HIM_10584 [Hirsutella minnesotensis 3608]|uniref:Uncharacterized protein n=1 Tax=Hirsutella minnesotensis 3608 TaxID=1043627 RepID=A0A0F7ZRQ7_9HYPO|nr:hypothetical protein HIM_10584 [Hirsutella minnesotensis 3608]
MDTILAMSNPDLSIPALSGAIMQEDAMDLSSKAREGTTSWSGGVRSKSCPILSPNSHSIPTAHRPGCRDDYSSLLSPTSELGSTHHQPQHTYCGPFGSPEPSFNDSSYLQGFLRDGQELAHEESEGVNLQGPSCAIYDDEHSMANDQGSPTASQCSAEDTCMDCIREKLNQILEDYPPPTSELSPEEFVDLCDESYPSFGNPHDEFPVVDLIDGIDTADGPMVIDLTGDSRSEVSANEEDQRENQFQVISDYVVVGGSRCPVYDCHGVDFIDLTSL